jgi:hypothetical protein
MATPEARADPGSAAPRPPQINLSVSTHMNDLPDLTDSIRYQVIESGTREDLTAAWKAWVEEAGAPRAGGLQAAGPGQSAAAGPDAPASSCSPSSRCDAAAAAPC